MGISFCRTSFTRPRLATLLLAGSLASSGVLFFPQSAEARTTDPVTNSADTEASTGPGAIVEAESTPPAGVTFSPRTLTVDEEDGTATFTVVLDREPTGTVFVEPFTYDSVDDIELSPAEGLTFTPSDWNQPKTVTVTGVPNDFHSPNPVTTIVRSLISGTDPAYSELEEIDVVVTVTDDEELPTAILIMDPVAIVEGEGLIFVEVDLSHPSSEDTEFTVSITPIGTATADSLALDPDPPTITVLAFDTFSSDLVAIEAVDNAAQSSVKRFSVSATASGMSGVGDPASQILTVVDDDSSPTAGLTFSTKTLAVDEEDGTATYTVVLDSQPTAAVYVEPYTYDSVDEVTLSPSDGLTFTPSNWSTAQTVTVTGNPNDFHSPNPITTIVRNTVSGTDPAYSALEDIDVQVTVIDDEALPTATLSVNPAAISERDGLAFVEVDLSHRSSEDTVFTVSVTPIGTATADSFTLDLDPPVITVMAFDTFSSDLLAIEAVDNNVEAPDKTFTVSAAVSGMSGIEDPASQTLTILDNESPPTVTLSLLPDSIDEGGNTVSRVTATLGHAASMPISVTVSVTDSRVSLSADRVLSFAAGRTFSTGTVTITAVDNNVDGPDLSVAVSGKVTEGRAISPEDVMLTVVDDEATPTVTLELGNPVIAENGGATRVTATLDPASTEPTTVTVIENAGLYALGAGTTLTIPAGETESEEPGVLITAVDDDRNNVPDRSGDVTGAATNAQGVVAAAVPVTLTLIDDEFAPSVTLMLTPDSIGENGEVSTVTAALSSAASAEVTLTVSAEPGPGTADSDFSLSGTTLTIAKGQTRSGGTVTITAVDNSATDPNKTVRVSAVVSGPSDVTPPAPRVLTIIDDEGPPTVTLSLVSATIDESGVGSRTSVTASLNRASTTTVSVSVSAGEGVNLSQNRVLTIAEGQTDSTGTVTLTAVDDAIDAPNRTVIVSGEVTAGGLADPGDVALVVTDDEATPTVRLAVANPAIAEAGGTTRVTATLSHASSEPTTVTVTPAKGLYTVDSGATLVIPAEETESTGTGVLITAVDDGIDNVNDRTGAVEGMAVNAHGVVGTADPVALTVTDDEATPTVALTLTPVAISENGGSSTVTATLSHGSSETVTLTVSGSPGSGTTVDDFRLSATTLTIATGRLSSTGAVRIVAVDNAEHTPNKMVTVMAEVSGSSGVTDPPTRTLTILDDEGLPMPTLTLNPSTIDEAGGIATVTATLDRETATAVTLTVSAGDGVTPSENRVLSFPPGTTMSTGVVTLTAVDNEIDEADRMVTVSALATDGGVLNPADVILTLVDDDESGLAIDSPSAPERDGLVFTVTLSPPNAGEVTVQYADLGAGSATPDTDYAAIVGGTLTFAAGETEKLITVGVVDDEEIEPDETVAVMLSNPSGGVVLATDTGTGTIANDDSTIVAEPGTTINREVDGQTVTVTTVPGVPAGVSFTLPLSLYQDVNLGLGLVDPAIARDSERFGLGEEVSARTLVDISVTPEVPAGGVAVCLPVTAALREVAGQRRLVLLHHDGDAWETVAGARDTGTELCAPGVTTFSPFAVGIAKPVPGADLISVLAGVARTLGSDAVEVLGGRFHGAPATGMQMTLAGYTMDSARDPVWRFPVATWHGAPESARDDRRRKPNSTAISARDLATRSSFELSLTGEEGAGGSTLGLWGRGSGGGFSGSSETGLDVDGALYSGYFGVDYLPQPSLRLGVAVAHSSGVVEHVRTGGFDAESDVTVTNFMPYAHWQVNSDTGVWAVLGGGSGEHLIRLADADEQPQPIPLTSYLAALGVQSTLASWGGFAMSAKADSFLFSLESEETGGEPGTESRASRVRFLLEGAQRWQTGSNSFLSLQLNVGGRLDGGVTESGAGLEIGGNLAFSQPASGFSIEAAGRSLLVHETEEFSDWGASLRMSLDPGTDGRGLSLSLAPSLGDASGNLGERQGHTDLTGVATAESRRANRLDAELAYGLALSRVRSGTVTPYGGASWHDTGAVRYRIGSRMATGSSLELSAEGTRTEQVDQPDSHGIAVRLGTRW